jgi:hypothetical protein
MLKLHFALQEITVACRLLSMRQMSQQSNGGHQSALAVGWRSRVRKLLVSMLRVQTPHHRRSNHDRRRKLPRTLLHMSGMFQQDRGAGIRKDKSGNILHGES